MTETLQQETHLAGVVSARTPAESRIKRLFDTVLAALAFAVLLPVLAVVAAAILIDSGWPVLYSQDRIGREGSAFRIYKFRSMTRDAHERRTDLLEKNEAPFPAFKIHDDPRVTRLGRLLRRSSIDELPQLWNVLRGEMSIVGPRPPLREEVLHYDDRAMKRLLVRPGLTCTWQVANRSSHPITFEEWVALDIDYIEHWSFARDIGIIAQTIRAVSKMTGS